MTDTVNIINKYNNGYKQFENKKKVTNLEDNIVFENIQKNDIRLSLKGLTAFKQQAETAKTYFAKRTQTVKSFRHFDNSTEIEIDYTAILAMDFPNGLKKGQELKLSGKSVFEFKKTK